MRNIIVPQAFKGLLYENGGYVRTLEPGKHEFSWWQSLNVERRVELVDIRERSLIIKGQEILTADKVAIRVSLLVYFRVCDPVAALHNVASYENRIYEDVQLSARRYLASRNLDDILKDRNEISDAVRDDSQGSAASFGVEILRADVKDLVFPGNLREIMNQVLETERKAEARMIQARADAEAQRVRSEAEAEEKLRALKTEMEELRLRAQAEQANVALKLESELAQAKALAETPQLLKLKQLEVLKELAGAGQAKFVVGLRAADVSSALDD